MIVLREWVIVITGTADIAGPKVVCYLMLQSDRTLREDWTKKFP